jgi:hypothetical protein
MVLMEICESIEVIKKRTSVRWQQGDRFRNKGKKTSMCSYFIIKSEP